MKTQMLLIGLGLGIALTSMTTTTVLADEEGKHAEHEETSQEEGTALPGTTEAILEEIHEQHEKLSDIVISKQLHKVHFHAFAIRDLAQQLPAKVSADKRARVEGAAKNIAKLAADLDASGDAGKQEKTEANLRKLDGVLRILMAQLPPQHDQ